MDRQAMVAELARLQGLVYEYEQNHVREGHKGFAYSTGPKANSDIGRKFVFQGGVILKDRQSALERQRSIAKAYGLING